MDLIFPQGKSIEIAFKVGIAGTAAIPQSVFVSLAHEGKIMSFAATKDGDEYKALIEYPGYVLGVGTVDFSINVKVNDRIFTPFKSTAEIISQDVVSNDVEDITQEIVPEETITKPKQITAKDLNFDKKSEDTLEKIPAKKSLMKMIEPIQPKILKPKVQENTVPEFSIKKLKVIFK